MKTSPQQSTTGHESSTGHARQPTDDTAPLPHESDQDPSAHHDEDPRRVGKQAHHDVERRLEDTDRRGGDDYQRRTQNDAQTNANSASKQASGSGGGARRKH